jgi:hypothetical protein
MADRLGGFNKPQEVQDSWAAGLRSKHGLPTNASLKEVEAKATELLENPRTALDGAELVLGRRVDGNAEKEPHVLPVLYTPGLSGADKFGLLLMEKMTEEAIAKSKK